MNKVIVEQYDKSIHGSVDDCDYVITFAGSSYWDNELAEKIANGLGYYGMWSCWYNEHANVTTYWLCHA